MIIERKEVVLVPTDDSATNVGMIMLVAIIALAIAATAWYFSTAGNNTNLIERTTETQDVTPVAVPSQPAPQAAPQTVIVPAAPAPAAPAPAAPAPAAPAPTADSQPTQNQDQ
jgi:hypothetical protein